MKMPVISCEGQLYIAAIMTVALVLPITPFVYFTISGVFPMPSILYWIFRANFEAIWIPSIFVFIWVCFGLFIVTTVLFMCAHYCKCFLVPWWICQRRKRDDFIWVRNQLLKTYEKKSVKDKSPGDGNRILLSHLVVKEKRPIKSRSQLFLYQTLHGKLKSIYVTTWLDNNKRVVAMQTPADILLDCQMGGHLLRLVPYVKYGDPTANQKLPKFDKFWVCHGRHTSYDQNKTDIKLRVCTFMPVDEMPLNPEKSLFFTKGSQRLVACCETASRDPNRTYACCCGGFTYRWSRSLHGILWTLFVLICVFVSVILALWISLAVFVAPEKVLPVYTFFFTITLIWKFQNGTSGRLLELRYKADYLTAKERFHVEGYISTNVNDEGSRKFVYRNLVGYINELLFYKGHNLQIVALKEAKKTRQKGRPLCVLMKKDGAPDREEEVQVGDEVRVYMPRMLKFKTKIREKSNEGTYFVEYHGHGTREDFPLQLMEMELIQRARPPKPMIIAEKGTTFQPGDNVEIYIPYLTGKVTFVDTFDKIVDVRYDRYYSGVINKKRFFAKAFQFWQTIPPDFITRSNFGRQWASATATAEAKKAAEDSVGAYSGSEVADEAACECKDTDSESPEDPDSEQKKKVRKDLDEKGVALSYLCEKLRKHGVSQTEIPLYAWQIFPENKNAVQYMLNLVKKENSPPNVVAAYMDLLARIEYLKQKRLRKELYETFREIDKHLWDLNTEKKAPAKCHERFLALLEEVDKTTNEEKLEEEKAKSMPDPERVRTLKDEVEQDKKQLEDREKPFIQWLKAFDGLVIRQDDQLEGFTQKKQKRGRQAVSSANLRRAINMKNEVRSFTEDTRENKPLSRDEIVQQGVEEVLASLQTPISLNAALWKQRMTMINSICISLFFSLAYITFGEEASFTLSIFIALQASILVVHRRTITPEQFDKNALNSAFAYHVNFLFTVSAVNFRDAHGRTIQERHRQCFRACYDCCDTKQSLSYHKWRALALHTMIQDLKTKS